jgi:hypothetical protein
MSVTAVFILFLGCVVEEKNKTKEFACFFCYQWGGGQGRNLPMTVQKL